MRNHNFSAGPAALPTPVLEKAQAELLDWQSRGVSVMEISHRSQPFLDIIHKAEADLRQLMSIPDKYAVIFTQGGASLQFSTLYMNLVAGTQTPDYIVNGVWGKKAVQEAQLLGRGRVLASSEQSGFHSVPDFNVADIPDDSAYLHITPNETINGVAFDHIPSLKVPLIADVSSSILSEVIDINDYSMLYAGAQKNIGPAGLTLLIIRKDLLQRCPDNIPSTLNYLKLFQAESLLNTPSSFAIYLAGLVFEWLIDQGGVQAMEELNNKKAQLLYSAIDGSDFYHNPVEKRYRSKMNIPFTLAQAELDPLFLEQAEKQGLLALKGHRISGGMRASIYNAVPYASVEALVNFMQEFEQQYG
ncbi:MAG: 3-phosphoserine/phosphohydroxythreonine transaminase [bacterium]